MFYTGGGTTVAAAAVPLATGATSGFTLGGGTLSVSTATTKPPTGFTMGGGATATQPLGGFALGNNIYQILQSQSSNLTSLTSDVCNNGT